MTLSETEQITLERLVLRFPKAGDARAVADGIGHWSVVSMLGRAPWPYTLADAEAWIARSAQARRDGTDYAFVITQPNSAPIGTVGLTRQDGDIWEIGYWLAQAYWGRGYVTEAARGLLDWAGTRLDADKFVSGHFTDNPASGRVLEKLGFTAVGETALTSPARGVPSPCIRYTRGARPEAALRLASH